MINKQLEPSQIKSPVILIRNSMARINSRLEAGRNDKQVGGLSCTRLQATEAESLGKRKRDRWTDLKAARCNKRNSRRYKRGNSREALFEDLIGKNIPELNEAMRLHIKDIVLVLRKISKIKSILDISL